jgi:hypothetical protein
MSLSTSNIPFEGVPKFNDGFYKVTVSVMVLSDNNPLEWDYRSLMKEIEKQYLEHDYQLEVKEV